MLVLFTGCKSKGHGVLGAFLVSCAGMRVRQKRQQDHGTPYKGMCGTTRPKVELACPNGRNTAAVAHDQFLYLAKAIAKYNATIRARFPVSDPFLQGIEACLFGVFGAPWRQSAA